MRRLPARSSRSRKGTADCAGCRPASPPPAGAGSPRPTSGPAAYQQLSFAGMNRIGHTGPAPATPVAGRPAPAAPDAGTQLQLRVPGESRHFDKAHWVASAITNQALQRTRLIAAELAATRGWNTRIITETGRALAVVLADHVPGDMIAWSGLSPALHSRDLSVTRTTEILELAGLLHDDRTSSFTCLCRHVSHSCPHRWPPMSGHWLRTRSHGGPRSRPRNEHTVRMNLNRVHPPLLEWASRLRATCARSPPPTSSPPPSPCPAACAARPSPRCARCSATARRPAGSSVIPPAASTSASGR